MTTRVITGSKQEIVGKIANLQGEIREAIVFIEEQAVRPTPLNQPVQDIFVEMESYMTNVDDVDDSREAVYTRMERE